MTPPDPVARWLPYRRPVPDPAVRLFCFPHAGGSASAFRPWAARLPPSVEVCAVQLPGRESRWRHQPPPTLSALVDDVAAALGPLLDVDYALCGTSFGGLVAFSLAHRLRELGRAAPAHLVVAAMPAPDRLRVPAAGTIDDQLLARLLARSPVTAGRAGTEVAGMAARVLGHDLRLAATYRYAPQPRLDCPVTAFGGAADPDVNHADLAAWRHHTTAACATHVLPGTHFFFLESPTPLLAHITTALSPAEEKLGSPATRR